MVKSDVAAPMHKAMTTIATIENPGVRLKVRKAYLTSRAIPANRGSVLQPQRFAHLLWVAKFQSGLSPRFVGCHAAGLIVGSLFRQKSLDLVLQLGVGALAGRNLIQLIAHRLLHPCTRPMARVICRQRLVSRTSCLRPSAVSR